MKIFRLVKKDASKWVWSCADKERASVRFSEDGTWCVFWSAGDDGTRMLKDDFESAEDACLAAEKSWPFDGMWYESSAGGYFCRYGKSTFRVKRARSDLWYAVRSDGKVLGRNGKVSWFATALEACRAVFAERHTPVDSDPFAVSDETWRWIRHVG